ncbi:Arsenical-resistance protein ACR3 [hydrothermal vent metagenome]|uniref:Arsenical-resistance protein ACR3 n=1 Tax=hydrothermal vent metagenome TaxID=652676 RepID=A0A3B0WWP8_9ZZZZ
MKKPFNILFLCTGNSCRSQIAEGWAKWYNESLFKNQYEIQSAGIETHGKNPRAITIMADVSIDVSKQESTKVTTAMLQNADLVVTVCGHADGHCPILPAGTNKEHWPLDDPAKASGSEEEIMNVFRASRDDIKFRVEDLLTRYSTSNSANNSNNPITTAKKNPAASMGFFERYLTLWVALCIIAGIGLGHLIPQFFHRIADFEIAKINLPVAVLLWLMIVPMLLKIDLKALKNVTQHWRGISVTLFINWAVKPFSMALLGWFFIGYLFYDWLPEDQIDSYIAGLIILAAAPCTAMVFVWSNLSRGEPHFTLSQVALNDVIMIFAFAPIVALLLGISSIYVPWETLLLSVLLYIVVPLIIATLWRKFLLSRDNGQKKLDKTLKTLHPWSLTALLATLIMLFGFQGEQIINQPLVIVLLAIPILIQVLFNSGLAYLMNRAVKSPHCIAGPSALIGASNFFELAVATAIALFGFKSGAALATVVGVLVEVPIMLFAVRVINSSAAWYEKGKGIQSYDECCPRK